MKTVKHPLQHILVILVTLLFSQLAFPCSNVMISGNGFSAVARTMDLESNTGDTFGLGLVGEHNTSNINMPQKAAIKAVSWSTQYPFLGQTGFGLPNLLDGINSKGVYAAFLYLPGISKFPFYNPKDKRPELAITDLINYILGTSNSVKDAINHIRKFQLVFGAIQVGKYFASFPIHLIIRDRSGHSAVIEWINHKTHIYNSAGPVLTNSPAYPWQMKNAKRYNYTFTGNTARKWDGLYMNGSGFYGIPGDWTPPSRFARAAQVIRHLPKPANETQAMYLAYSAIQSDVVPLGSNSAATIWMSLSDLKNSTYYFRPIFYVVSDNKGIQTYKMSPAYATTLKGYHVADISRKYKSSATLPKQWVHARIQQGTIAPNPKQLVDEALSPTPGPSKVKFRLVN